MTEGSRIGMVAPWVKLFSLQMSGGLETQNAAPVSSNPETTPHSTDWPGAVPDGPWLPTPEVLLT